MKVINSEKEMPLFQTPDKDGYVDHLICEGSRQHVVYYDTHGAHCSVRNCELNRELNK